MKVEAARADTPANHDQGLAQYCTRHNGFEVGRSNGSYEGACATLNERAFLEGYRKGQALYEARSRLSDVEAEISQIDEQRDQKGLSYEIRDELFEKKTRLEVERVRTRERIERLERETQSL